MLQCFLHSRKEFLKGSNMATIDTKFTKVFHLDTQQVTQIEKRIPIDDHIDETWLKEATDYNINIIDNALQNDPYYTDHFSQDTYPVIIQKIRFLIETLKEKDYTLEDYIYLTQNAQDVLDADAMIFIYEQHCKNVQEDVSPRQYYDYFQDNSLNLNHEIDKSIYDESEDNEYLDDDLAIEDMFHALLKENTESFQLYDNDSIFTIIEDVITDRYEGNVNDKGELIVPFDDNDNFGMIISEFPDKQQAGIITMVIFDPITAEDQEHFSSGFVIDYPTNTVIWENIGVPMMLYHHEVVQDCPSIGITVRIINQDESIEKIGPYGQKITAHRNYFGAWHYYENIFEGASDQETFDAITIDPYTGQMTPPEEGLDVISTHNFEYREKIL